MFFPFDPCTDSKWNGRGGQNTRVADPDLVGSGMFCLDPVPTNIKNIETARRIPQVDFHGYHPGEEEGRKF